ncbi:MAG: zf-HC2 domain-containing protein [Kibdelosporangium sp.]
MAELRLTCAELVELITEFLDGSLDPATTDRVRGHLAACEGCAHYVGQFRETIGALGHLGEESLPPDACRTLLEAFRGWDSRRFGV